MRNNSIKAWHFAQDNMLLGYGDGRKIVMGETLSVEGDIKPCENGLHASRNILNALQYAAGSSICRVYLSGTIVSSTDKTVASHRTCIWCLPVDVSNLLLRKFARMCALDVAHLWDAPDVVLRYLRSGNEAIRTAACDTTWDRIRAIVAKPIVWDAAWAAANAITSWDATRTIAWAAARDAAKAIAWNTNWATSRKKQSARLHRMAIAAWKQYKQQNI